MKYFLIYCASVLMLGLCLSSCREGAAGEDQFYTLSHEVLKDKIKGAWATQTIGVTYGGPTEFRYLQKIIPDSVPIAWNDSMMLDWMINRPGLYDDVYMDLTFVQVFEEQGMDAPAEAFGKAYAEAEYFLWHANQQGRYNLLSGIKPPASGHWLNNPHADDIDFQIEADFAGIMNPGMPNSALEICDRIGHIMNSGDGYYGGVFVAALYSYAFVLNDIPTIVDSALAVLPPESTFYQCMADVIRWHQEFPDDWKRNWQNIEERWGKDIGCPDGVDKPFNIDAKMNSAYVLLGLLYGEGDLARTMDIATRAGQDSDCNPATAGAIVGAVIGYSALPEYWSKGLAYIEDMDFKYTTISLNEAYEMSYRHALEMVRRNGGEVTDKEVKILKQEPKVAPLEENFPGYALREIIPVGKRITAKDQQVLEIPFEGIGIVLRGRTGNLDYPDKGTLLTPEETYKEYVLEAAFSIDGERVKTMKLPLYFITRAHELFFQYELPPGQHTLKMEILNPGEKTFVEVREALVYQKSDS